jgi:hypothetical protein
MACRSLYVQSGRQVHMLYNCSMSVYFPLFFHFVIRAHVRLDLLFHSEGWTA